MRRVILATVGTIVGLIMLLSFKTHPVSTTTVAAATTGPSTTTGSTGPGAVAPATTVTTAPATKRTVTVTGNAAATRYGPVQVEVTVTNGQITSVEAVEYPTATSRDRQINARAIPQLNSEVLAAQSARIDTVSGATYTTRGYVTSLQSALDQAGLA